MRAPEELAEFARQYAEVGDPWYLVGRIIKAFDLGLEIRSGIRESGMLDLVAGRVAIVVKANRTDAQRFSAAHELGHYLLALKEDQPLMQQMHDRKVEQYCNAFASHLLLPRPWLRRIVANRPQSFDTAIDVTFQSQSSLTSAIFALQDGANWSRELLKWSRIGRSWELTRSPYELRARGVRSTESAQHKVETATDEPTIETLQFDSRRGRIGLDVELVKLGHTVFGLVDSAALQSTKS